MAHIPGTTGTPGSTGTTSTVGAATEPGAPTVLAGVLETEAADPRVRPQDDLFRHVNGSWLDTAEIPADRPSTGSFHVLRDQAEEACRDLLEELASHGAGPEEEPVGSASKIAALYSSFLDEDRVEALGVRPLEVELDPVLRAPDKESLARVLGARLAIGFTGPLDADVEVDLNDPQAYTSYLGQAGLGLPDESYYREETHAALREAYTAHVARMLDLAGVPERLGGPGALATDAPGAGATARAEAVTEAGTDGSVEPAARVMAVETALAQGHWDRVACRDIEKINNPRTWEALTASAPGFPWEEWRAGMAEAAEQAGTGLRGLLATAIVEQPDYLPHMARVWQDSGLEDLRAWAAWHVVHDRAALLSRALVEENFDFYSRTLQGVEELRPRWKRAVGLVQATMGHALGEVYVERHFPPEHKARMETLVSDLLEAYRQSIASLEWMSPGTRRRALDKLELFTPKIGYPERWRDYSAVRVTPGDVLASVRSAEACELARTLGKLGSPVDRLEWHMTPQTVNAYYNPTMNEIVFPAAILQPPFFDPDADDAVNYAGIGAVIGHEIGHGFDDQGSTFDGTGKVADWWTAEDREAFSARTRALIAQYDLYRPASLVRRAEASGTPVEEVPHVNGALTIGENIGDLGGLGIALKAYRMALARQGVESFAQAPVIDGLSALERFFYSWARIWRGKNRDDYAELLLTIDPHSPGEFRCNGIVRNVDAFYEAFDVDRGDALWLDPEERVSIW
ncbi:M13 family metallopeptidase [Actinomyces howellii]|uniref:Neutral endopeptidase n=1 Tax=Actinomyces howellii TaxID=52771 RepID=A0A448HFG9_9ACTO|nr:M13-type metalloendopeptidase [Actinomyces howellii]VEG27092.1 Neutral endopeptidase [Actinomyces howellii]